MTRRKRSLSLLASGLVVVIGFSALAATPPDDLAGQYRVRGECAYRDDEGEYHDCVAWNTLELVPTGQPGRYRYVLETATFATTAGGCGFEGELQARKTKGARVLSAVLNEENVRNEENVLNEKNRCPVRFVVDRHTIRLDLSPEQAGDSACRDACGANSSLYTDPFPRRSRKALKASR